MKKIVIKCIIVYTALVFLFSQFAFAEIRVYEEAEKETEQYAGEFFDIKVPLNNYYFAKSVVLVFGKQGSVPPKTEQEIENATWDELLLSFEAFRRNIEVNQQEVDGEITKILTNEKVSFDWKADKEAYAKWVKQKVNETVELFENQIKHLIQVEKLRQQVMNSIQPQVTEEEAHQEFLNEYNSLSLELVEFATEKEAQDFYKKVKANPKFWEKAKNRRPKEFKQIGFVSLKLLIDLWKIPKEVLYNMLKMQEGSFSPPASIHKGYGVFRVLKTGLADEAQYPTLKDSYYQQIKRRKQYDGLGEWFKILKQQAKIKVYKEVINPASGKEGGEEK